MKDRIVDNVQNFYSYIKNNKLISVTTICVTWVGMAGILDI
jgi:hypothetical protein